VSVIGATLSADTGQVTFDVVITSPDWAEIDTLEVFANETPDSPVQTATWLQPLGCWTSRPLDQLPEAEPCVSAALPPQAMTVESVAVGDGFQRWEAHVRVTLAATDIAATVRSGARGGDAWVVFRVRGNRAIYPVLFNDVMDDANIDALVSGDPAAVDAILRGAGVPAQAFTAPIFVDFDGGGYSAPFAP
jgi:hypothetical protein